MDKEKKEYRPFRFGTQDIAALTKRSVRTVRKDRREGRWSPDDLGSVVLYCEQYMERDPVKELDSILDRYEKLKRRAA
jgi:hypothetical protein